MPKETFLNLPETKRSSIMEAIQTIFLEKPNGRISVSDIVKKADIPRGSFYMYFDDLEDMFDYLLDFSLMAYEQEELERIVSKKMTFFEYMESALSKDIEFFQNYPHQKIVSKFMSNTHVNNFDYDRYLRRRHSFYANFFMQIDRSELEGLSDERIMYLYNFMIQFKMQMVQTVLRGRLTAEQVCDEYHWFIKIIKQGLINIEHE
ncbi:TetR/AcrR family transcriptional regulator [Peloplasma aerotolerans]|uniref:TetR/AcrR family transcriptional regulator n=1 Tax=Peloplasma aerotolerans TaxID=3044389 RepID=A0AAW6UAA8_9MOLU|nr:TetR/AcrR family transcriptional regulator [Mariniplasma sp. M4Ah]MDI6452574.1 TetR/AcrR family transcriptional regulator [Mariniplasma sp. M4Ah]